MIVDAHHHVWDPAAREHRWLESLPSLRRAFSLEEFEADARPAGISSSVLVQVLPSREETEELLALAAASEMVAGVVGWVDLGSAQVDLDVELLRKTQGGKHLVGVRYAMGARRDRQEVEDPHLLRALQKVARAGLVVELLARPHDLPNVLVLVDGLEGFPVVLDHGGKPQIASGLWEPWSRLIGELAARNHVLCKLSGLVTEAGTGWTEAMLTPYVDRMLSCFGPQRLIFGSDWPVCTPVASYADVKQLAHSILSRRASANELAAIFAENAIACYHLELETHDRP